MKRILCIASILLFGFINTSNSQTLKGLGLIDSGDNAGKLKVSVFADGDVRGLISNDSEDQTSTTGSIGVTVIKNKTVWTACINIASTIDTLKSDFGKVVLNPSSGKRFTSGLVDFRAYGENNKGFHAYISGSSSYWKLEKTTKSASVLGIGALMSYDIIPYSAAKNENEIAFGIEGGLSYRAILGNISLDNLHLQESLGTKGNHFLGVEMGIYIKFNQVTAGIQGYILRDLECNEKVDGITSFQITGGISISASIFNDEIVL